MKKILALLLSIIFIVCCFAGCNNTDDKTDSAKESKSAGEGNGVDIQKDSDQALSFADSLKVEKIGSISISEYGQSCCEGGIYYKIQDGKYGLMTFDGKNDTGAVYYSCEDEGDYFKVTTKDIKLTKENVKTEKGVESVNSFGLADAKGNMIVPCEFAGLDIINERYVKVIKATKYTKSKDDALIYFTDSRIISFAPGDEDICFEGVWYVYDITTGQPVKNVTGNNNYRIEAKGKFISYYNKENKNVWSDDNGNIITEKREYYDNGSYYFSENGSGTVYAEDGSKLFTIDSNKYDMPFYEKAGYYCFSEQNNGNRTYSVYDKTGKKVSADFNDSVDVVADKVVKVNHNYYKFDGTPLADEEYTYNEVDDLFGSVLHLYDDDKELVITTDGKVLYEAKKSEDISVDKDKVYNKKDEIGYCYKDKAFNIKNAYGCGDWTFKVKNNDNSYDVVDAISGKALITGYSDYSCSLVKNHSYYIYAKNSDGNVDIYSVSF